MDYFLAACKLANYTSPLEDAGYDDLEFLQTRTEDQLLAIAKCVSMPIGHAQRFAYAVKKSVTTAKTPATPKATAPAELPQESKPEAAIPPSPPPEAAKSPKSGEAIVICIDRSFSMRTPIDEMKAFGDNAEKTLARRSRMDAVKQIFYAFRDRVDTLDTSQDTHQSHQLGLIQFDNKIDKMLDLTPALDTFENIVDDIKARGQTAIYSVISCAVDMLRPVFKARPSIDLRVLVLTDGESNVGVSPKEALLAVNSIGATVDAIIVGDKPDANLRRIVELTGGACFNINSLSEGFQLMESEAVVSMCARRGGTPKPPFVQRKMPADFGAVKLKNVTRGKAVRTLVRPVSTPMRVASARAVAKAKPSASANKRLLKELRNVVTANLSSQGIHVLPDATSPSKQWRVLLEGPTGTPFENGVFSLLVTFPPQYPFSAPSIRFETPIFHCNVSDTGRICLEMLYAWKPSYTVVDCIKAIIVMLKNPDTDNSLRSWIAELTIAHRKYAGTDTRYVDGAKKLTVAEASLSVDGWKKKLGISS